MLNVTQIPAARVELTDGNVITRDWFRFFSNVYSQLGSGNNMASGSFTTADIPPKTVTVVRGIITSII